MCCILFSGRETNLHKLSAQSGWQRLTVVPNRFYLKGVIDLKSITLSIRFYRLEVCKAYWICMVTIILCPVTLLEMKRIIYIAAYTVYRDASNGQRR